MTCLETTFSSEHGERVANFHALAVAKCPVWSSKGKWKHPGEEAYESTKAENSRGSFFRNRHQATQNHITEDRGFKRAAPSGGALYPMDIYAVVGENCVKGLESGAYHYDPESHAVSLVSKGDLRNKVAGAALSQTWMATAPLNILITAEYDRITRKYGKRGVRYAIIEAGHIGQNILLQSEAMGLGAGVVGAFNDDKVRQVINIPPNHEPLLILPVGYKTEGL